VVRWKKDPEFYGSIKGAIAARLVLRLKKIEAGADGWHGAAWLTERLLPLRYSKPELQLNLIQQNNTTLNALSITISEKEVREIEAAASTERENVRQMFSRYRQGTADYSDGHSYSEDQRVVDVQAEQVETESTGDETVRKRARDKFAQYRSEQPVAQAPIVRKDGDEQKAIFWHQFVCGDNRRLVERSTALFVVREIVIQSVGPRFAQGIVFESEPICVSDVLLVIERLSGPWGWKILQERAGYVASR